MDTEARRILHDEQTSDCRSFGSNIRPSSQTRKISIGVMADSKVSTRSVATQGDRAVVPNTERVISNVGNCPGEKSAVGVTPSFNIKQTGGPREVKCSWLSKSFYQKTPTSETILQANQASTLQVSHGGRDEPNGIDCAAGKHSLQLFSYQTSTNPSNNYKKFGADAAKLKERKDGSSDEVKEFTFTTAQEVLESNKADPEDKINRTENRTENLRMKLCQILGTTSTPKSRHSGSHARSMDEESLPREQHLNKKENKSAKAILGTTSSPKSRHSGSPVRSMDEGSLPCEQPLNKKENKSAKTILGTTSSLKSWHSGSRARSMDEECLPREQCLKQKEDKSAKTVQNSDTIETDSENPDYTLKRPVTRSLSRKRASSTKKPGKCKSGPSSKNTEKHGEKSIFSFQEKWIGKQDTFPNDGSLKKKSQRKNSKNGQHKICLTENDTTGKLHQDTLKNDLPLHGGTTFSLGKIMGGPLHGGTTFSLGKITGGFIGCLSEHQTKCPETEKLNQEQEFYQPPIANTDQHGELEDSENGNQQEYRSDPVIQNVAAKSQDDFPSPTFQLKTPIPSFSPNSTPKTGRRENDVSSPASTERTFSLGSVHSLRTLQASEQDFNGLGEQIQPSVSLLHQRFQDMEELNSFIPRKGKSSETEKEEQGGSSDSSSEERNFQGYREGSGVRHGFKRKSFALHPIKRLCKHEDSKSNDRSPVSVSSQGTGDNDWIGEASEQNQDGFVRAVELLALELGKLQSKLKSMTSQKSSEILKSAAEEIHLQLQNVHSQIQTDMGKFTNLGKSKRKRLETRFEDQQKQLKLIYNRFKEEVNQHLQDCRSTVEDLDADQIDIKRAIEKQRGAHKKLLSQVEQAVQIQLDDAQRKITLTQEKARGKLLQLKQVVAMCLKDGILD